MKTPKPFIDNETLRGIRNQTDWKSLFHALGLERDKKSTENDWWTLSPFVQEKHASFHINNQGWYCHSTGKGGGVIELVQQVIGQESGQLMNCYQAGQWLVDQGLSVAVRSGVSATLSPQTAPQTTRSEKEKKDGGAAGIPGNARGYQNPNTQGEVIQGTDRQRSEISVYPDAHPRENSPIRQTLVPRLELKHSELHRRGISQKTCEYLGCGYLPESSKSSLAERIVFQIRGVQEIAEETFEPVILSHIGRALTSEQQEAEGKWHLYAGFYKSLELYNIDHVLLDREAIQQAQDTGYILVVEGCFDVAKLVEAGVRNVVATFGAHLSEEQIKRLELIRQHIGIDHFRFWYDRDSAGAEGEQQALEMLKAYPAIQTSVFDWNMEFSSDVRPHIPIPSSITDVCEFSGEQIRWLGEKGII